MSPISASPERPRAAHWFTADRPIAARVEDRLGRRRFAEAIASAVTSWRGRDSLVIALYGVWGSGKSSIKNMVLETLRDGPGEKVNIAEFASWQFANREKLTASFFDQVGITLGRGDVASREARGRLLRRWKRYAAYLRASSNLVTLLRTPTAWAAGILAVLFMTFALSEAKWLAWLISLLLLAFATILNFSSSFAERIVAFLEVGLDIGRKTLEEVKGELAEALKALTLPVLVVIDDLDRLTPAEILEMFQLVKANADVPNVVYLLLFERTTVEKSITKLLEVDGRDYLEKIVQVGFDVPAIERTRLEKVLFEGLNQALFTDQGIADRFDGRRWQNLFLGALKPYFETLRRVNRFLSTMSFHASLFQGQGAFEVNPVDLVGLEVLRMFEPDVYRALPLAKDTLTTLPHSSSGATEQEERRKIAEALIERASSDRRTEVREMMRQLFPTIESALGGTNYSGSSMAGWLRELRVCTPEVFDRYFSLTIPEGDISQAVLERILALSADRDALRAEFESVSGQGLLGVLLERLDPYKETVPVGNAVPFITALFDISELVPNERHGFFEIAPAMYATRLAYWILKREPSAERRSEILRSAIRDSHGLRLPVRFVTLEVQAAEKKTEESKERLLRSEDLEALKRLCVDKIVTSAANGTLIENPDLLGILYRWKEWAGDDPAKAWTTRVAETPEGALRLAKAFMSKSIIQSFGDYGGRVQWYVRLSDVESFIRPETLEEKLSTLDPSTLGPEDRRAVEALHEAMDRRRQGKPDRDGLRRLNDD